MLEACPLLVHFGTQMREAVKYSLFLDSYNESSVATDTGSVYYHFHSLIIFKILCILYIYIYYADQQYKVFY